MDHLLQIVLGSVAVLLGACLVPLLVQMYRTAKAMQELAESAREDLKRISGDIHQARLHLDKLAALTEQSLALPATASAVAARLLRTLTAALGRGSLAEALVTAVKFVIDFFRRSRGAAPTKEKCNE